MKGPLDRWSGRPVGGRDPEDRAAEQLREVRVPEISEARLDAVAQRIDAALSVTPRPASRLGRSRLFLALVAGGFAAAALVVLVGRRSSRPERRQPVAALAGPEQEPPPVPAPVPLPPPPPIVPVESLRAVPGSKRAAAPRHRVADERADGLSEESELLREALRSLNVERDPQNALRLLDRYRARFPSGVLAREAEVARLDADVRLGRNGEALGILDRASAGDFDGYPRPAQLRLLRAELLSNAGRCQEAEPVFSGLLAEPPSNPATERALFGRASCRAKLGDAPGSRADLTRYLALFPEGPHAADARRAVEGR
ncbi:MAG: tetratricopeptide repeat protein [Myxococcales bacterium]